MSNKKSKKLPKKTTQKKSRKKKKVNKDKVIDWEDGTFVLSVSEIPDQIETEKYEKPTYFVEPITKKIYKKENGDYAPLYIDEQGRLRTFEGKEMPKTEMTDILYGESADD